MFLQKWLCHTVTCCSSSACSILYRDIAIVIINQSWMSQPSKNNGLLLSSRGDLPQIYDTIVCRNFMVFQFSKWNQHEPDTYPNVLNIFFGKFMWLSFAIKPNVLTLLVNFSTVLFWRDDPRMIQIGSVLSLLLQWNILH